MLHFASPNIIYQINDINGNRVYYVQGNNYITTDHAGDEKVFYIKDNTIVDYSSDMIAFHLTEDGGWVDIRNKKDLFIKETIVNDDGEPRINDTFIYEIIKYLSEEHELTNYLNSIYE